MWRKSRSAPASKKQGREGYIVESIGEVRVGILGGNAGIASEVTVKGREVEELEVPTRTKEESTEKPDCLRVRPIRGKCSTTALTTAVRVCDSQSRAADSS